MTLNKFRTQIARIVLVATACIFLIATPITTPAYAGNCLTAGAGNCGG